MKKIVLIALTGIFLLALTTSCGTSKHGCPAYSSSVDQAPNNSNLLAQR